jgi:hypothetical protein
MIKCFRTSRLSMKNSLSEGTYRRCPPLRRVPPQYRWKRCTLFPVWFICHQFWTPDPSSYILNSGSDSLFEFGLKKKGLLIQLSSWQFCGGVDFLHLINDHIVSDEVAPSTKDSKRRKGGQVFSEKRARNRAFIQNQNQSVLHVFSDMLGR